MGTRTVCPAKSKALPAASGVQIYVVCRACPVSLCGSCLCQLRDGFWGCRGCQVERVGGSRKGKSPLKRPYELQCTCCHCFVGFMQALSNVASWGVLKASEPGFESCLCNQLLSPVPLARSLGLSQPHCPHQYCGNNKNLSQNHLCGLLGNPSNLAIPDKKSTWKTRNPKIWKL